LTVYGRVRRARRRVINTSGTMNHLGSNEIGVDPSLLRDGEEKMVVSALERTLAEDPEAGSA